MGFWRIAEIVGGVGCASYGLAGFFIKRYPTLGWTTKLIWGEKNIPAWIAGPFYFLLGVLLLYWALSLK